MSEKKKKKESQYTVIRVLKKDHKKLRLLAALKDKSMLETVGELVDAELKK